jgi:hypothetical protein
MQNAGKKLFKMHTKFWVENLNGSDQLGNLDIDGRMILK